MRGQLVFDFRMNIYEEQQTKKEMEKLRVSMVDPCYYCLCNSCINNAENIRISPKELPYEWNPCFFCDNCINFDGKSKENMERTECSKYRIDNYHAEQNRKKIKIVRCVNE